VLNTAPGLGPPCGVNVLVVLSIPSFSDDLMNQEMIRSHVLKFLLPSPEPGFCRRRNGSEGTI